MNQTAIKHITLALVWFFLSTVFTWWFIKQSNLYQSQFQELLSGSIAGGKWGLQILLALIFLKEKKWAFIQGISVVCLVGSVILVPYCLASVFHFPDSVTFFVGSLVIAVLSMLALYYQTVRRNEVGLQWFIFFVIALLIAVSLQLTVVFEVIKV